MTQQVTDMAIRQILYYPHPILRKPSQAIAEVNDGIKSLASDMIATMYAAPGIGLAAPQVGVNVRLFVMDCSKHEHPPRVFLNPSIVEFSAEQEILEEGCLSLPEQFADIERPRSCRIAYMDMAGQAHEVDLEGIEARCAQHEIDHLNGKLFIDHISRLKRQLLLKKLQKHLAEVRKSDRAS